MSSYVCKKPLSLHGASYACGQIIPEGAVLEKRALSLIKSGYIVEIDSEVANEALPTEKTGNIDLTIPIKTENGTQTLTVSTEAVIEVLCIMQLDSKEAEKAIEIIKDEDVLILLNACDSRKGIKNAAQRRASQNSEVKEEKSAGGC